MGWLTCSDRSQSGTAGLPNFELSPVQGATRTDLRPKSPLSPRHDAEMVDNRVRAALVAPLIRDRGAAQSHPEMLSHTDPVTRTAARIVSTVCR